MLCVSSMLTEASELQTKKAGKGTQGGGPPSSACRTANFPRKSNIWKKLFAVWKWNFRSWLSVFWCLTRVDRPLWKLFVCTHVEPPDVSFSSTHRKNSMVPSQGFTGGLHS